MFLRNVVKANTPLKPRMPTLSLLKPDGNFMSHLLQQSVTLHFVLCFCEPHDLVIVKCFVLFGGRGVRTEFLNILFIRASVQKVIPNRRATTKL
jgi:hypothetical protein